MKPLTRLADLKAKHYGNSNWSELVIDDGNSRAYVISAAPGSKVVSPVGAAGGELRTPCADLYRAGEASAETAGKPGGAVGS